MQIPAIISKSSIKLLSGLANNNDSILPMAVKDGISACAVVDTYRKEGGIDDAREKSIEEFGTGAFWLFGIPTIKKIIDKTIYPLLKLDSKFDLRILKNNDKLNNIKSALEADSNTLLDSQKQVLSTLDEANPVIKSLTNKQLYKGLFVSKFAIATVATAIALSAIIKYKQKTTQKRIEDDINKNNSTPVSNLEKSVKESNIYKLFTGEKKMNSNPSFKGLGELFMYNPIANTAILDGVITTTRLKEARKGERKEVALKEIFQILFIYAVAKPTQMFFEKIGRLFKLPTELDPQILFSKDAKENIKKASEFIESSDILKSENAVNDIYKLAKDDIKNPLIGLLENNGVISLVKDKETSKKALSYMSNIDEGALKKTMSNILDLNKSIDKLTSIKAYKAFSVIANVLFGAFAMGVIQPKLTIAMRKLLNNGDNRNPAIIAQENELKLKAQNVKLQ